MSPGKKAAMGALQRLKAYFGMVPADELDGYAGWDPAAPDRDYRRGGGYEPRRPEETAAAGTSGQSWQTPRVRGWAGPPGCDPAVAVRGALAMDTAPDAALGVPAAPPPPGYDVPHPLARITTLQPRSYNEARMIGERYRDGIPVIMNLTEMDDPGAKRLVDFAAGLAFALRGSIDKVTSRVFLLSPPDVEVSAADRRRLAEGGFFGQA